MSKAEAFYFKGERDLTVGHSGEASLDQLVIPGW
jgi:hypothetical protein